MKKQIAATLGLVATTFASLASATTYIYTFDDMSHTGANQAKDTFNTSRYWELKNNMWGTVWESPYTFSTNYPAQANFLNHFHIDFKGQVECLDTTNGTMGRYVNNVCKALPTNINRGPFYTHNETQVLFFQLISPITQGGGGGNMIPFVVKTIDVYNKGNQAIILYVRKTDGGWFYWPSLSGYGNGTPSFNRVTLTSGYSGKFTAMAWQAVSGATWQAVVGRVEVTD